VGSDESEGCGGGGGIGRLGDGGGGGGVAVETIIELLVCENMCIESDEVGDGETEGRDVLETDACEAFDCAVSEEETVEVDRLSSQLEVLKGVFVPVPPCG